MSKRLLADIAELQSNLYSNQGIYYVADETSLRNGYACIFGPPDTIYEDCPMLYEFRISDTFPFDSPTVLFQTYDGKTRFHPNMYVDGKCCLSILGTWSGPSWASTMRLSTVLVTLQSLMDSDPLRHEPSFAKGSGAMGTQYKDFVEHSCIQFLLKLAETGGKTLAAFTPFQDSFKERLPMILKRLHTRIEKKVAQGDKALTGVVYGMEGKTDYVRCLERVKTLCAKIEGMERISS